eukprot:jgi/Psemu1/60445/gm1.60445_g
MVKMELDALQNNNVADGVLGEFKEPFFKILAVIIEELQTSETKNSISAICWQKGLLEKCFDPEFQKKSQAFQVDNGFLDNPSEIANLTSGITVKDVDENKLVDRKVEPLLQIFRLRSMEKTEKLLQGRTRKFDKTEPEEHCDEDLSAGGILDSLGEEEEEEDGDSDNENKEEEEKDE